MNSRLITKFRNIQVADRPGALDSLDSEARDVQNDVFKFVAEGRRQSAADSATVLAHAAHAFLKRERRNITRRARHEAYTSLGLVRVKGALGGTYYE